MASTKYPAPMDGRDVRGTPAVGIVTGTSQNLGGTDGGGNDGSDGSTQAGLMRRSQFEIRMDMLRAVKEGAEGPTQIMYKANLSWITLQQHLKTLLANGCLRWVENGNRKKYELTSKGLAIMSAYANLLSEVGNHAQSDLEQRTTMVRPRVF